MAATQTSLDKFFKTKKSARAGHGLKGSIKSDGGENKTTLKQAPIKEKAIHTPPVTPKRKLDNDEETKRKRRREALEDDATQRTPRTPRTPKNRVSEVPQITPRSAKKRLIMGSQDEESAKETERNLLASPSKLLKLDSPKLTSQEVKERLGTCNRLDELRARLLKVNQCREKLSQFREKTLSGSQSHNILSPRKIETGPQLEKFTKLQIEIPISPKKTPIKTPIKSPFKPPAYERYQHLVEKPSEELVLPFKYRLVKEVFRAVDTVVSILHNRQELITYSKLKPAVQQMLSRTFGEQYLGQIRTVFPLAYIFKQESIKNGISTSTAGGGKSSYQLTIKANLDYKQSAAQNLSKMFDSPSVCQTPKYRKMDSVVMVERRNIFHNLLIDQLKDCHEKFLQSLDPPISSAGTKIKRWHPEFPLEDVPEVEAAPLPEPPEVNKLETARDVLEKAQSMLSVNPRMEQAVIDAAAKVLPKTEKGPTPAPQTPVQPANVCAALKGISSSLLEKVRAREAAKRLREMTRTTQENNELAMLSRLPEIARIIRNSFVTEKKAALPWEMVAGKISASYSSLMGSSEVDRHLHLLVEVIPDWCTIHKVRSGTFLKINKARELSSIQDRLNAAIKERR